jgi:putative membrane protein
MMHGIDTALSIFIVAEHVAFMVLEMAFWQKPLGRSIFRRSVEEARSSASLAANQGLYNGFLAAGLALALYLGDVRFIAFFLGCVAVAGIFAGVTVSRRIFFVQAVPAILAGLCLFIATR